MSKPSPAVAAALSKLGSSIKMALEYSCDGDWSRVTLDAKGSFTVHNSTPTKKTGLRIPAPKTKPRATPKPAVRKAQKATALPPPVHVDLPPAPIAPTEDEDQQHLAALDEAGALDVVEPPQETCPRCKEVGHKVLACPQPLVKKQKKRTHGGVRITSEARDALTAAERPPVKGVVVQSEGPAAREERRRQQAEENRVIVLPPDSVPPPDSDELLSRLGNGIAAKWRDGLPADTGYEYLPDVLALYGLDKDLTESCLRHPERVELRPESFHKDKRYVVLGFWKGDINIILGLRDVKRPCIIAAYVTSRLEHDIHRVGHAGGGGAKKIEGTPKNPRAVAQRLRAMGAEVEMDARESTAPVKYHGQDLGSIKCGPHTTRQEAESDYQRMQRKIHAIDRREASVA